MQLLALILYNADGGRRVVSFRPGALNVVTGQSASGKSTLLDIFEYCTGRKTATFPIGPMTDTVSWYAALFQLDTTRAFAARPAPVPGKKTAAQAMLKFGPDLEPPPYTHLAPNTDRHTLRQRLGRFIGIEENHSTTLRSRGPHPPEPTSAMQRCCAYRARAKSPTRTISSTGKATGTSPSPSNRHCPTSSVWPPTTRRASTHNSTPHAAGSSKWRETSNGPRTQATPPTSPLPRSGMKRML